MADNHTPGPWEARPSILASVAITAGPNRVPVATTSGAPGRNESLANAALIAAAPDLLAAVKALTSGCGCNRSGHATEWFRACDLAESAIAKAEARG